MVLFIDRLWLYFSCTLKDGQELILPYLTFPSNYAIVLEKAMVTHSSTLACKIPWMEEPGGLQSMGWLRVWYDWMTSLSLFSFMHWRRKWQPTPVFLPGESQGQGSLVSHRVGHDWSDLAAAAAAACGCIVFPGGSDCKESPCNAGDPRLTPGSGRPLGEGKGYPLQCSCWGNPMDRGAWWAAVHGVTESDTTEWLGIRSLRQLYCYRSCLRLFSNGFIPEILPPKHQCHFLTHPTISRVMASLLGWLRSDNEPPLTAPSSLPVEYLSGLSVLNTKQYNFKLS